MRRRRVTSQRADHYVERALYDLTADPYELDNLIDSAGHQELATELRDALIAEVARIERRDVTVEPYPDVRDRGRFPETTVRRRSWTAGCWSDVLPGASGVVETPVEPPERVEERGAVEGDHRLLSVDRRRAVCVGAVAAVRLNGQAVDRGRLRPGPATCQTIVQSQLLPAPSAGTDPPLSQLAFEGIFEPLTFG